MRRSMSTSTASSRRPANVLVVAFLGVCSFTGPAVAAPDPVLAGPLFLEAKAVCEADHGALWGRSLCGPILLVDYTDREVLANQADSGGRLRPEGGMFRGAIPEEVVIANTPTVWSGTLWTQLDTPLPTDPSRRRVLLAHELFHRIQPLLGLTRPEAPNGHLDTLEGRYLMQLEWRALARALETGKATRRAAIADALAFRRERYRLYPNAAHDEAALEVAEGVPEYTGVRLGLATDAERIDYAVKDLSAFVSAPTLVRSFAYATGPAYGLLLDAFDPSWRDKLQLGQGLDGLLAAALKLDVADGGLPDRVARYDDGKLRAFEIQRDRDRLERLATWKSRLIDGPVLLLPLESANFQFNPQTLVPLEGVGTVYPSMRITDAWGSLEVQEGGALVRQASHSATVSAVGADNAGTVGPGWRLSLNPGWLVRPGERAGDIVVVRKDKR